MQEIILNGNNFTLRPYRIGDEVSLTENSLSKQPDLEKNKKWLEEILMGYKDKENCIDFAICIDDKVIGHIGGHFDKSHIFAFWYWLGVKFQGRGMMTDAIRLYTEYMFKTFELLQRIEAETTIDNISSKRVLEKNNFKFEGILRRKENARGEFIDKCMFSKLRGEK